MVVPVALPGTHYQVDGFLDFASFPPTILGGFPRKTTLQEFLGTMGLEPTDCRGKMLSISHKQFLWKWDTSKVIEFKVPRPLNNPST